MVARSFACRRGMRRRKIQPQVDRDLFVARSAGVETTAGIADARHQLAFDKRVDVFIVAADPRGVGAARIEDRLEALFDRRGVGGVQHARARQRIRPRQAACHIVFEQPPIERERHAKIERRRIGRRVKPSGP